ncbi:TPA: YhcH/YjgK/YiaL family protein [Streptococcus suis]|nr:YhcH/YjgK/YiaL family protein [Streptococcus suis]HEP1834045.1 YhcH/YjgK/YiaL family protein [Streptococcus suis]
MIITNILNLERYNSINPQFWKLQKFIEENDLVNLPEGKIEIDGEEIFGNCFSYIADGKPGEFFETHRKYIDIHLVVNNIEAMATSSTNCTSVTSPYCEEKDIELFEGEIEQIIKLNAGTCLITFPEDLHQPKIGINEFPVKKIVFKVKI